MIRKITYLFICSAIFSLSGCKKSKCFKATGKELQFEQELGYFNELELYDKINIILVQDTIEKAIIKGGANLVSFVSLQINDGRLIVKDDNKCNYLRTYKKELEVEIHFNELNYIYYAGAGNITSTNSISASKFGVDCWDGSGLISLIVETDTAFSSIHTGPADINFYGITDKLFAYSSGNGYINHKSLFSKTAYINNSGTGDITCFAKDNIGVEIYSLGNVICNGNPNIEYSKVYGKGEFELVN